MMKILIFCVLIFYICFASGSVNSKPKPIVVTSYEGTPPLYDMTYDFRCPSFRLQVKYSRTARNKETGESTFQTQILLNGKKTNTPENFEKFLNERMLMTFQPKCSNEPGKSDIWVRVYGYFPFRGPERYYEGVLATTDKQNNVSFIGSERQREDFSPLIP
jgi:hypothetical protein